MKRLERSIVLTLAIPGYLAAGLLAGVCLGALTWWADVKSLWGQG